VRFLEEQESSLTEDILVPLSCTLIEMPSPGGRVLMIRRCDDHHFELICAIINDGALAYKGIISKDCWREPYMSSEELQCEIDEGVVFWGYEDTGVLLGVMGLQQVRDVTLIRHAYVRTRSQKRGIGTHLLSHLRELATGPILIGTWADAAWAIRFYEKCGFQIVCTQEKDRLLREYWTVPERQIATSLVLADPKWRELNHNIICKI
jgi:GNAT superfamily N-acetyltransferase